MALALDLQGNGTPVGVARQLGDTRSGTIAAAGSTLAAATVLTNTINYVTSAATTQGVSLPVISTVNASSPICKTPIYVFNASTADIKVWPGVVTDAIGNIGAGTAIVVGTKASALFDIQSGTRWLAMLGAATS